uniref:Trm112p-like protein n=1 Tax=Chromera velia CCMP2878 TaxID=1169474 RepID=A0A0G4ICE5_9ALVE|mmetsp:Transcript_36251/g.71322  ORF Transcript_36251/g.71322 Transcript_36251/m.71322 type:complete len:181 (+) Transcript_36251:238-780(+)|eukprot:Cvel_13005.t1-p1 / transcript=Cvel_13005.t1 / gene=Cvel_13005 / organism=Chromera_velia_CCMP2878 / gene_product=tRNA methyltransferase 112 homolog, putative / transcript_product=tRNA methyltransferase 112 homolog, putative / location=Cvel_scaffold872:36118-38444(+) / protein_length=180 / sequence_SO=supercontig / SO=protein_coding / is_pseudo=false
MRLLTHNLLMCNRKQCKGGFPFKIVLNYSATGPAGAGGDGGDEMMVDTEPQPSSSSSSSSSAAAREPSGVPREAFEVQPAEFSPEFVVNMLPKLEWAALVQTCHDVMPQLQGEKAGEVSLMLPPSFSDSDRQDENFLRALHHVLVEFHIMEAKLVCPECGREYPISKGIPNMLLQDDEVS